MRGSMARRAGCRRATERVDMHVASSPGLPLLRAVLSEERPIGPTDSWTPECSASTACTQCPRHPVHDSFHDQQAASGPHITLGDAVQVTLGERRTVTHRRAPRTCPLGRQATTHNPLLRRYVPLPALRA